MNGIHYVLPKDCYLNLKLKKNKLFFKSSLTSQIFKTLGEITKNNFHI